MKLEFPERRRPIMSLPSGAPEARAVRCFAVATFAAAMLLASGRSVAAQSASATAPQTVETNAAAGIEGDSIVSGLLAYLEEKRRSLLYSLREMPAHEYDREFIPGQRTFGQQATHVAEMNFAVCSALAGEPPPIPDAGHGSRKEKLVDLTVRSFDYCRGVLEAHGDAALSGVFRTPDGEALQKAKMLFFLVGNWADHYGHFATYLRLAGLETPETWRLPAEILQATTRR